MKEKAEKHKAQCSKQQVYMLVLHNVHVLADHIQILSL